MLTIQTKERISMIDEAVMKRKIRRDDKDGIRHYSFLLIYFGDMNCLISFFKYHFREEYSFILKLNKKTLHRQNIEVCRAFMSLLSRNCNFLNLCNVNYRYVIRRKSPISLFFYSCELALKLSGGMCIWDI